MTASCVLYSLNGPLHLVRVERSYITAGTFGPSSPLYAVECFVKKRPDLIGHQVELLTNFSQAQSVGCHLCNLALVAAKLLKRILRSVR